MEYILEISGSISESCISESCISEPSENKVSKSPVISSKSVSNKDFKDNPVSNSWVALSVQADKYTDKVCTSCILNFSIKAFKSTTLLSSKSVNSAKSLISLSII